jgi:hypothetical protein
VDAVSFRSSFEVPFDIATDQLVLSSLRDNDITDVIDYTFSTEEERFGEIISIPLIPGGENIEVTQDNKKEYVE